MAGMYRYKVSDINIPLENRSPLAVNGEVVRQKLTSLVKEVEWKLDPTSDDSAEDDSESSIQAVDVRPSHGQGLVKDEKRQKTNTTKANRKAR